MAIRPDRTRRQQGFADPTQQDRQVQQPNAAQISLTPGGGTGGRTVGGGETYNINLSAQVDQTNPYPFLAQGIGALAQGLEAGDAYIARKAAKKTDDYLANVQVEFNRLKNEGRVEEAFSYLEGVEDPPTSQGILRLQNLRTTMMGQDPDAVAAMEEAQSRAMLEYGPMATGQLKSLLADSGTPAIARRVIAAELANRTRATAAAQREAGVSQLINETIGGLDKEELVALATTSDPMGTMAELGIEGAGQELILANWERARSLVTQGFNRLLAESAADPNIVTDATAFREVLRQADPIAAAELADSVGKSAMSEPDLARRVETFSAVSPYMSPGVLSSAFITTINEAGTRWQSTAAQFGVNSPEANEARLEAMAVQSSLVSDALGEPVLVGASLDAPGVFTLTDASGTPLDPIRHPTVAAVYASIGEMNSTVAEASGINGAPSSARRLLTANQQGLMVDAASQLTDGIALDLISHWQQSGQDPLGIFPAAEGLAREVGSFDSDGKPKVDSRLLRLAFANRAYMTGDEVQRDRLLQSDNVVGLLVDAAKEDPALIVAIKDRGYPVAAIVSKSVALATRDGHLSAEEKGQLTQLLAVSNINPTRFRKSDGSIDKDLLNDFTRGNTLRSRQAMDTLEHFLEYDNLIQGGMTHDEALARIADGVSTVSNVFYPYDTVESVRGRLTEGMSPEDARRLEAFGAFAQVMAHLGPRSPDDSILQQVPAILDSFSGTDGLSWLVNAPGSMSTRLLGSGLRTSAPLLSEVGAPDYVVQRVKDMTGSESPSTLSMFPLFDGPSMTTNLGADDSLEVLNHIGDQMGVSLFVGNRVRTPLAAAAARFGTVEDNVKVEVLASANGVTYTFIEKGRPNVKPIVLDLPLSVVGPIVSGGLNGRLTTPDKERHFLLAQAEYATDRSRPAVVSAIGDPDDIRMQRELTLSVPEYSNAMSWDEVAYIPVANGPSQRIEYRRSSGGPWKKVREVSIFTLPDAVRGYDYGSTEIRVSPTGQKLILPLVSEAGRRFSP